MWGALAVFAPRAAVTFKTRWWIKSNRCDKFNFPGSPLKSQKRKEFSRGKTNNQKQKTKKSTVPHGIYGRGSPALMLCCWWWLKAEPKLPAGKVFLARMNNQAALRCPCTIVVQRRPSLRRWRRTSLCIPLQTVQNHFSESPPMLSIASSLNTVYCAEGSLRMTIVQLLHSQ
jgi:hypothetical protein